MAGRLLRALVVFGVVAVVGAVGGAQWARSQTPFPEGAFVEAQDGSRWVVGGGTRYRMSFVPDDADVIPGLRESNIVVSTVAEANAALGGGTAPRLTPAPTLPPTPSPRPTPSPVPPVGGGAIASAWSGRWETSYGTMQLTVSGTTVTGTYDFDGGRITGTVTGNRLVGTWSQIPSFAPPSDAGDMEFTLSADGQSFTGRWRYGSTGEWTNDWNGTRSGP